MRATRTFGVVIVSLSTLCARPSRAEDQSQHASGRGARVAGWVSIAVGAEGAIVAVATSVLLVREKSVRDSECNADKVCSQRGLDASGTMSSLAVVNTAAWIVSAAGIGVGTILLLTHRPDTAARTAIAVSPTPGGVGVSVWSTF